jgi:type IV secretion system protein VirB9
MFKRPSVHYGRTPAPVTPYQKATQVWDDRIGSARVQAKNWRLMAFGSLMLSVGLASALVWQSTQGSVTPWVVEVDRLGQAQSVAQIAFHLARFIEDVRGLPADAVVLRQDWLRAHDFTTDRGAAALNNHARVNDPFANLGKMQIAVEVSSVIRASPESFRVAWIERRYDNGQLAATERWTAILTIVIDPPRCRSFAQKSARGLRQCHQLVEGGRTVNGPTNRIANPGLGNIVRPVLLVSMIALSGCTTFKPPQISYDTDIPPLAIQPSLAEDRPRSLHVPPSWTPAKGGKKGVKEAEEPVFRIETANDAARVEPRKEGYFNAVQVFPFSPGALYQIYAAPGQITDIALEPGEQLTGSGPVSAGDTVRWVVGDTESGSGDTRRVHIMVKPTRPAIETNLVVNTDRRTYLIELRSHEKPYMPSVAWFYPEDRAARGQIVPPAPVLPEPPQRRYRYTLEGDNPPWRPVGVYDDGRKVYVEFSPGIAQGEMPPLLVIGPDGKPEIVNYRAHHNVLIVDRLFAAAELRLGGDTQQRVRITRSDGRSL